MEKSFEYLKVQTAMDSVDIKDIGNVILQAINDEGLEWYLYIATDLGFTFTKEFGPILRECETVSKNYFCYTCDRREYNEKTICKTIANFLNNPKREITQVIEIDQTDLNEKLALVKRII